jgi:diguanylate cyclase (GGDEF)-like protein
MIQNHPHDFLKTLFFYLLLRRRELELEVVRRSAELVDLNKELHREIGIRRDAEEMLKHQASHDNLTNLPNRNLLADRLQQALARAPWHHRLVALLFLDLDGFKQVNDTLGHHTGDELLRGVAARLLGCVRPGDTVARLGGDEFIILLSDVAEEGDVRRFAGKIHEAMRTPFIFGKRVVHVGSTIGISVYPHDGNDAESLLKLADTAMYHAKNTGKDRLQFYSELRNV